MLRAENSVFNMLYFLCQVTEKWKKTVKNVFDFIKICIYNDKQEEFFITIWS